jgi:hypothetical protein
MNLELGPVFDLAERQHGVAARWQMTPLLGKSPVDALVRDRLRVARGVYLFGEFTEMTGYMAAALSLGPKAVVGHRSALGALGLRPHEPGDIHICVPHDGNRARRKRIEVHRRRAMDIGEVQGIPVTSPSQTLRDVELAPHELYRALEEAEKRKYALTIPASAVVRLKREVMGYTRSDAEARFLLLCHAHGFPLPLVNLYLNGIETDFHWPHERLVVEVDGWEFHKERPQFEEDRRRGLVHIAGGYDVVRVSALQVEHTPELVVRSLSRYLPQADAVEVLTG